VSFEVEAWSRYVARRTIIDAVAAFLARMRELGNPLTDVRPQDLLRKDRVWFVRPVYEAGSEGSGVGFFLRPDGCVDLLGRRSAGWTPYHGAAFFDVTSAQADEIEASGEPRGVTTAHLVTAASNDAEALVRGLAALLRLAEGASD
jgi:hypothetical protein